MTLRHHTYCLDYSITMKLCHYITILRSNYLRATTFFYVKYYKFARKRSTGSEWFLFESKAITQYEFEIQNDHWLGTGLGVSPDVWL